MSNRGSIYHIYCSLERVYRRHQTADTLAAWKNQFSTQRRLFRQKASDYWYTTIAGCAGDARQLWFKINKVTKPSTVSLFPHTEYDLAKHFTSKVDKIRASTARYQRPSVYSAVYSVVVPARDSQRSRQADTECTVEALSPRSSTDVVGEACR